MIILFNYNRVQALDLNRVRHLKRSDIKKLLYHPIDKIKDKQKREDAETFLKKHCIVKEILELVAEFKTVLLGNEKQN